MIKTILFDFTGVVTTARCFPSLAERLGKKFNIDAKKILNRLQSNDILYTKGNESTHAFWKKAFKGLPVPYHDFVSEFSSWYTLNNWVLDLAKRLKSRYQVVILSDNFDAVLDTIRKDKKLKVFEKIYLSNELHLSKADERLFRYALKSLGRKPEECIFIDDKEKNLAQAESIGMRTILFRNTTQLKMELKHLGIDIPLR